MIREELRNIINESLERLRISSTTYTIEHPAENVHGDFACNVGMVAFAQFKNQSETVKSPRDLAMLLIEKIKKHEKFDTLIEKVEVAGPGFINFFITWQRLLQELHVILEAADSYGSVPIQQGRKLMIEYAHPNTHKELHIGHMRTLITGESLARILEFTGADVFRANYQGDIGPQVARSIWGTLQLLEEKKLTIESVDQTFSHTQKAKLLGDGYVLANQKLEERKEEMDILNKKIYQRDPEVEKIYQTTRQWSLDYYEDFYKRFGTEFNTLYFESQVADQGMQLVREHIGDIFCESEGAIIFPGEEYGLHNRVFITQHQTPTYEAKEIALARREYQDFAFDQCIHVVGNEQKGYFEVVINAIELVHPDLKDREYHLPMGMFNLVGAKISSRTGNIIRVDELIDTVKGLLTALISNENLTEEEKSGMLEATAIGAIKCSTLKAASTVNIMFDPAQSVSLHGDSGPYLQYTYARCSSVLGKVNESELEVLTLPATQTIEEEALWRILYQFPEVVSVASTEYSPHYICNYLFVLAARFNAFYAHCPIVNAEDQQTGIFRLSLTQATAIILKQGLFLLGIETVERM